MSEHPLTRFVHETFGQQFAELLLAGYRAVPSGGCIKLHITELEGETETDWVIELAALRLPHGDEPLILAALLKLLLNRPVISQCLEFELGELLAVLQWQDSPDARRNVEEIIIHYSGLIYDKHTDRRTDHRAEEIAGGGYYHMLSGYVRDEISNTDGALDMKRNIVYFDSGFIRGLKEAQVSFAGINFGLLRVT